MALYECIFIMRQDIAAQDVHRLADRFIEMIKSLGGDVLKREYWGLRTLAYIVKKNKKGHYIMLGVSASDSVVKELERNFKINEDVIKYLTIRVESIDEAPSHMMQSPADSADLSAHASAE
jgi:small subunit ribosomal protein S6